MTTDELLEMGWKDLNVERPGEEDIGILGDVVYLRSGRPTLGPLAYGTPVDATHWQSVEFYWKNLSAY